MLWRQKLRYDLTIFQSYLKWQIWFLFAFVLGIFSHQFDIWTMCRSRDINDYGFFSDLDFDRWPIPVIFLDNTGIIHSYLHIMLCSKRPRFNEVIVWYRVVNIQLHRHTHTHMMHARTHIHQHYNKLVLHNALKPSQLWNIYLYLGVGVWDPYVKSRISKFLGRNILLKRIYTRKR